MNCKNSIKHKCPNVKKNLDFSQKKRRAGNAMELPKSIMGKIRICEERKGGDNIHMQIPERGVSQRRLDETAAWLASYSICQTMLELAKAPQEENDGQTPRSRAGECVMLTMRMREIERALRSLPMGKERLVLELHYLQGTPVERCAEQLYVSRATAYRLKRRGLAMLAARENRSAAHA